MNRYGQTRIGYRARRPGGRAGWLGASVLGLALCASPVRAAYNVLFIAVDDLRPEMNCYGATHMITPNMDRLANSGRLFKHHYVSVPTCGASSDNVNG